MSWKRSYVIQTKFLGKDVSLIGDDDICRAISAVLDEINKSIKASKQGNKFKNIIQEECGINFLNIDNEAE